MDKKILKFILELLKPYKVKIAIILFCMIIISGFGMIYPLLQREVFDSGIMVGDLTIVIRYTILILATLATKRKVINSSLLSAPKTYDQYLKAESKVPIIGILNNNKRTHDKNYGISSLAQRLFASFKADGYDGICLSEWDETDLSKTTLNIRELSSYTPIEKIRFYTHYCLIDYILVEISETFLLEELRSNEIDIIIYSDTDTDIEKTESSRWIVFSISDNFESFFEQLHHELSEENK